MKKMLLIMGMICISLSFSNVYGQASFVPVVVNVHVAAGVGNVIKPKLNFYKLPNQTTPAYVYTWYDRPYFIEGASSSLFYVAVPEAGNYNIVFQGENPLHTVLKSNIRFDVEKGYYNLDIYVDPLNNNSRMTVSGPH